MRTEKALRIFHSERKGVRVRFRQMTVKGEGDLSLCYTIFYVPKRNESESEQAERKQRYQ